MYSYDDRMRAVKLYIQYARHPASSTTNDERLTTNDKIQKSRHPKVTAVLFQYGRGDRIRTCGLLVPNQARYQTALRPDNTNRL